MLVALLARPRTDREILRLCLVPEKYHGKKNNFLIFGCLIKNFKEK